MPPSPMNTSAPATGVQAVDVAGQLGGEHEAVRDGHVAHRPAEDPLALVALRLGDDHAAVVPDEGGVLMEEGQVLRRVGGVPAATDPPSRSAYYFVRQHPATTLKDLKGRPYP